MDVVLHTTFDRLFVERFPNLRVHRFLREIFIFEDLGNESTEKTSSFEQDFSSFCKEIGMSDDYDFKDSQKEGGKLFCTTAEEMRLSIDPDGQVIVTDISQDAENRTLEQYRAEEELWTENDEEMWGPTEEESIAAEKVLEDEMIEEGLGDEMIAAEEGLGVSAPTDEEIFAAENELDEIMSAAEDAYRASLLPSAKEDEKERKKE